MSDNEATLAADKPQKHIDEESKKSLQAWLSDSSTNSPSTNQDHELYVSKTSWDTDVDHDTGQWLFDRQQWATFNKEDGRAVLWLQGPPGCGKSTLTARIITVLQSQQAEHSTSVLYHYCHCDPQPTTSLDIVKSLLTQCLESMTEEVVDALKTLQTKKPKLKPADTAAEKLLWTALQKSIAEHQRRTYLIIDGLDESQPNASPLGKILSLLKTIGSESRASLLLSSRFDCDIVEALQEFEDLEYLQVDMDEEAIRRDMLQYITFRVNSKTSPLRRKPQQTRDDIIQKVCQQAQSSFLYASLVLDELKGERIFSPAAIAATLQVLPSQLRNIYERLLEIPKASAMGTEVFQWMSCAMRPLDWDEVRSVLAIVDGKVSEDHLTDLTCDVFIQESCGPLVEAFGNLRDKLRFVHPTVKDVLLEKDGPGMELEIPGAHTLITMKLLHFLQNEEPPTFSPELSFEENRELISEYMQQPGFGLYSYAVLNWFSHVARCGLDLQEEVEEQLCSFLSSSSCIFWLQGALFMAKWKGQARDSTALTTDVVESLETWIRNRTSTHELGATMFVRSWINHFLDLMQDWGRALEFSPFWIHLIPKQFIDYESHFRQALTFRTEQAVNQLEERPFLTAKTHPALWQQSCISVDSQRGLAYTWEQRSVQLSCYHMRTGLLAAQTKLDAGDKDLSSFELVMGVQCPQNRYLALLFRDKSENNQKNPIYDQLRKGLQPTSLVHNDGRLAWVMQNEICRDELFAIPYALGVANVCSLTCVLELSHDGFMRTNLFGHPKWSFDSFLAVHEQLVRWELDDINLLAFSPDSSLLATPTSVISMDTGKTVGNFFLGLEPSVGGCAIATDFRAFALVRSGSTLEFVQVPGSSGCAVINSHKFSGVIHILGMSNGGRFTLLLRVHQHPIKSSSIPNPRDKFLQDCSIGVFDSKKKQWTSLLEIQPPFSKALSSRDFSEYHVFSRFKPESRKTFEPNKVVFQCPRGWSLSSNVRCANGLSSAELLEDKCIVAFESEKLKDGFGTTPSLVYVSKTAKISASIPRVLYADFVLGSWTPIDDSRKQSLPEDHLYDDEASQLAPLSPYQFGPVSQLNGHQSKDIPRGDRIIISPDKSSQICQVRLGLIEALDYQYSQLEAAPACDASLRQFRYQISVSYSTLQEGGKLNIHAANIVVHQSGLLPLQLQDIVIYDGFMAIGASSIDLGALTLAKNASQPVEIRDEIGPLIKSFEDSCQPFAMASESTLPPEDGVPHYTIFSSEKISFQNIRPTFDQLQLTDISERRDIMLSSISTALGCNKYVVQFSKLIERKMLKPHQREAAEYEVFVYVFDSDTGYLTWSIHTTSAGKLKRPPGYIPKATWALHPKHPLLFWTLPGHALHVSDISSSSPPINVGDSITIENEDFESISFSPNGRYVALLAASAFVQIMFVDFTEQLATHVLVILDLHTGINITLKVLRQPTLSFDIDDTYLKVYRLTGLGGIRMDRYSLPDLEHHDQQILTFIPDYCCCATCSKPFKDSCHISVREHLGLKRIVLCHSPIPAGSTNASGEACQPLILSIASPELPVDSASIGDSIVLSRTKSNFPPLIGSSGDCIRDAFTTLGELTLEDDLAARTEFMKESFTKDDHDECRRPEDNRRIPQMQVRLSNSKDTSGPGPDISSVGKRWQSDYQKSISDLKIQDYLIQSINSEESFAKWSAEYNDLLPETWAEFAELLALVADDPEVDEWVKILCQDAGIGCVTPLYAHTFHYNNAVQEGQKDFDWTSAVDIGWIEEHAEWFIRRVWKNDFEGARMWYPFQHYREVPNIKVKEEKKEGKRDHLAFTFESSLTLELSDENLDEDVRGALRKMVAMRKFVDDMEVKLPGAGKMFRTRLHQFLNHGLITKEPAEVPGEKTAASQN